MIIATLIVHFLQWVGVSSAYERRWIVFLVQIVVMIISMVYRFSGTSNRNKAQKNSTTKLVKETEEFSADCFETPVKHNKRMQYGFRVPTSPISPISPISPTSPISPVSPVTLEGPRRKLFQSDEKETPLWRNWLLSSIKKPSHEEESFMMDSDDALSIIEEEVQRILFYDEE